MGRRIGPVCRTCRKEGEKLFLKGRRCDTARCAFTKRGTPPGEHPYRRVRRKGYGLQLREKQKMKSFYGILDRQFKRYFKQAAMQKGNTGENLLILIERRLDNAVYLLRLASSRPQARQLVRHGHIYVNDRRCDVPSRLVEPGNTIAVHGGEKIQNVVKENLEQMRSREIPKWLQLDENNLTGTVSELPARLDVSLPVEEQMIVELLSR
jgi:small subunit ribosomal protein S4